uniref:Uncharacterized protein n=1 Tax=Timema cristinae TaxID=61476 RepID=A0A7R9D0Q1_TIMCR|nr:unnamed protein product [Timema cristinae]
MEAILDSQGVSGRDCILRTICEASQLLGPGESLLQDLLHVIFRFPSAEEGISSSMRGYDVAASRAGCEPWTDTCPFSLLAILLTAT